MKSSLVARLDLRLPPSDASVLGSRQYLRPLLYAGICGLLSGLWLVSAIHEDQQQMRELHASMQAELSRFQADHRQRELELKALQELQAQRQQHLEHRERWHAVGLVLQALGHGAGPSGRLTQLRVDSQGITLTGQVAPPQLQPWLHRLTAQVPELGPWRSLDIGSGQEVLNDSDFEPATRFVIRFGAKAAPGPLAP